MFKSIVWASDGSEHADRALEWRGGLQTKAPRVLLRFM